MSEDMVERVAKAIYEASVDHDDFDPPSRPPTWETLIKIETYEPTRWRKAARAAILAMRPEFEAFAQETILNIGNIISFAAAVERRAKEHCEESLAALEGEK